ncbi:hypothetical protein BOX15_Mlig005539g1, partial [Macrostomum lignano]
LNKICPERQLGMLSNFWRRRRLLGSFLVAAFSLYICWAIYALAYTSYLAENPLPEIVVEPPLAKYARVNSRLSINPDSAAKANANIKKASPQQERKKSMFHLDVRNPPSLPDGHVSLNVPHNELRKVPWCDKIDLSSPISAQELRFLSIHPNDKDVLTYSAYYDRREKSGRPVVRAVGIALAGRANGLLCQLWYRRYADVMAAVPASVEVVPEGNGRRYDSVLLSCENRAPDGEAPYAVSFARSACAQPNGIHSVRPLPAEPVGNGRIAVCVTPLNLHYDKVDELVQTFELNRLFGADWFFVYNHTTSERMTKMLANEQFARDLTILPFHPPVKVHVWPLPPGYTEDVKYYAQMAMLQDCIMRASADFEFAVFTDMDEVIVPRSAGFNNWRDLIRTKMPDLGTGGLSFQNTFYRLEWPSDPQIAANATIAGLKLSALLKLRREAVIYSHGSRSKMIVRPHFVRVMGVHNVWRYFSGSTASVDFNTAGMHHYRSWEGGGEKSFVQDPVMLRYREQLVARALRARTVLGLPVS